MNDHVNNPSLRLRPVFAASFLFVAVNAGVFLFLGIGIVPYWESLTGEELQTWFADHFGRFSWMMIPVHLLAISTTITAFVLARRHDGGSTATWWIALVGLLSSQAFNFTIFGNVLNPDLSSQTLDPAEALDTLDTWRTLHWIRTALVLASAAAFVRLVATRAADGQTVST